MERHFCCLRESFFRENNFTSTLIAEVSSKLLVERVLRRSKIIIILECCKVKNLKRCQGEVCKASKFVMLWEE